MANTTEKKKPNVFKEMVRKFIVSLKRRPQMIPLAVFVIAFLVYSLNLSQISDTTAKLQSSGMGLAGFVIMLFSILSMVAFMNAFPYRKKVNVPMLVIMFVMQACILFADVFYINAIAGVQGSAQTAIQITKETAYIAYADYYLRVHIGIIVVGVVLTALLPVYSKLLRKIKTSIDVEDNGKLAAIDISGED